MEDFWFDVTPKTGDYEIHVHVLGYHRHRPRGTEEWCPGRLPLSLPAKNRIQIEDLRMATNKPKGDGRRIGAVKKRTQLKTKVMGEEQYTKRSKATASSWIR